LSYAEAAKARAVAMNELREQGEVERLTVRGWYMCIFEWRGWRAGLVPFVGAPD
jgi:hypothetical protein